MTRLAILSIIAISASTLIAGTFQKISFTQPTFSDADPLGVQAITTISGKVDNAEHTIAKIGSDLTFVSNKVGEVENTVTTINSGLSTKVEDAVKSQLTNNSSVVIGQMTGSTEDVGLTAKDKTIVLAVNRDIEDINPQSGSITLSADSIKFDSSLDHILVGNQTLQSLLATSGGENGDTNVIEEIKVNGVKVNPENKVVNLTIPSIEGLAVAAEVDSTYAKKSEIPSTNGFAQVKYVDDQLTNYVKLVDLKDGIQFNTLEAKSFKIDGKDVSVVGHKHDSSEITNLSEVVSAKIAGLASETFVTNKLSEYVKKSDVSSVAQTAITGINNATTIAEIKVALTNFLQTLVIPAQ